MFIKSFRMKNLLIAAGAVLLGLALALVILMMAAKSGLSQADSPVSQITEQTISTPEPSEKVVWLTFDDGPSAVTAQILDVLKEKNIPATFFVIGATTERGKKLYQRILDEGHALGIHSYSHRYQQIYESADAFLKDFSRLSDHLEKCTGVRPNIFRFPGGSTNRFASPEVMAEIQENMIADGNVWFDWNARAKDDGPKASSADQMFQNILESAGESSRILILMHDDALRTTAPDCVKMLIDHYLQQGYTFKALTSDTPPIQFGRK